MRNYHYFVSYCIRTEDESLFIMRAEVRLSQPISSIKDIEKAEKVLKSSSKRDIKEITILSYQLMGEYKDEDES